MIPFHDFSLYHGKFGHDAVEAKHLMDCLDWPCALKDIQASVNWLKCNGSRKVSKYTNSFSILLDINA